MYLLESILKEIEELRKEEKKPGYLYVLNERVLTLKDLEIIIKNIMMGKYEKDN